ncbi:cobyrinate a,c-diamide synthase [Notoacmeibacter sp. MSK16QG-6]|uniref:cobyrinate a,c-diamide synthase n=1 Tax=Notoacmeibacter sp. MSK16QG-6 TaxID=2957982 RepID=UPI00209EC3FC|nr:cobyrinate a,c-diamide synthase [Notoacmeibacter sp. MSK16QG-6]MCP1199795.1 cobyrinate a,c-diamide synthase [Notoacmeibacter sp. MSK16QG-6]
MSVPRAIIVGAPRSGSGKTSVTTGLLRAFARRGLRVRGAKSGPDYIDPGFHAAATGAPGVNLDSWAMEPALLAAMLADHIDDTDLLIVESAMGLFDGIEGGEGRSGAASDLARRFGIPVLLVLDCSGQSRSAAAVAHGFASFDPEVRVAGVALNRIASDRHEQQISAAMAKASLSVFGTVRRDAVAAMPERHLGLVQAREHAALEAFIEAMADTMEVALDLDAIWGAAAPLETRAIIEGSALALPPPAQRIAMAQDDAFSFIYPHLLRQWRNAGAEISFFSPLADETPSSDCDLCWLPGGYPELHAGRLASAHNFLTGIRTFAKSKPVHGECGGFMVLGQALEDADGVTHEVLGLLSHQTSYAKRKMNLGYRRATLSADCPIGSAGTVVRGHEFHYARVTDPGRDEPLARLEDGVGNDRGTSGGRRGNVTGTFFHAIAREPA